MPSTDLQVIAERLEKLEAENQALSDKLEKVEIILGELTTDGVEAVAARTFRLTDEAGLIRALFNSSPDGAVGLMLMDTNYQVRAVLRVDPAGLPQLELYDKGGEVRASLLADEDFTCLTLADKGGQICVQLSVKDGSPALILNRDDDKCGFIMTTDKDSAMLGVKATDGAHRVMLHVEQDTVSLVLADKNGLGGVGVAVGQNGPQMILIDAKQKLLFEAPALTEGQREELLRYVQEGMEQKPPAEIGD